MRGRRRGACGAFWLQACKLARGRGLQRARAAMFGAMPLGAKAVARRSAPRKQDHLSTPGVEPGLSRPRLACPRAPGANRDEVNRGKRVHSSVVRAADCRSAGPWLKSGCALLQLSRLWRAGGARCSGRGLQAAGHDQLDGVLSGVLLACLPCPGCLPQRCGRRSVRKLDTLGIEPRAFRMRSGCDTTTPCAHLVAQVLYVVAVVRSQLSGRGRNRRRASVCDTLHALARVATRRFRSQPPGIEGTLAEWLRRRPAKPAPASTGHARPELAQCCQQLRNASA